MQHTLSYSPALIADALVVWLKSLVSELVAQQNLNRDQHFSNVPLRCLVIGLGESGLAMLDCLKQSSPAALTLAAFDTRTNPPALVQLQQDPRIQYLRTTQIAQLSSADFDVVLMSPGLSIERGYVADWLAQARLYGVLVLGEMDLFSMSLELLREQYDYQPKVIGITGSNGKTTVTTMTTHVLNALGVSAVAAGNISPAAITALFQALKIGDLPQVWVLELSSFQLSLCQYLKLDAGVLLNISEDHLDWHVSMQSYHQAKQNIYRCARVAVLNADDPYYQPDQLQHTQHMARRFLENKPCIYFGLSSPNDWRHWGVTESISESVRYLACRINGSIEPIVPVDALKIRGLHNVSNALAVLALCQAIGVVSAKDEMINALASYRGQAHRVEWVNQVSGVDFFDDSKGTNVGATQAALMGLSGEGYALFVIVGGDGKGQDFAPLASDLLRQSNCVKAVFLIGRDAPLIGASIEKLTTDQALLVVNSALLQEAVTQAFDAALRFKLKHPAQKVAVLLSPACASLDQFKNYAHRAQIFCDRVNELAALAEQAI